MVRTEAILFSLQIYKKILKKYAHMTMYGICIMMNLKIWTL